MSWSIGLILNTVNISDDCADELNALMDERGSNNIAYDNCLEFNPDDMEYMDYLNGDTELIEILIKHNATGVVRFASVEGDNSGSMWEHRFDDGYAYASVELSEIDLDT